MLLSDEGIAAALERGLEGDCHLDPVLAHNPYKYHELIADLLQAKLFHFTRTSKGPGGFVLCGKERRQAAPHSRCPEGEQALWPSSFHSTGLG